MYERFCNEGLLKTYPLGRAPKLALVLCLFFVSLALYVNLSTGKAAEAQGMRRQEGSWTRRIRADVYP